jgi:large subunit ribosomal protein L13
MKTYSVKQGDVKRETHIVDAKDKILGRFATEIAELLMGKQKAMFSRNGDVGDCVTVINAEKIVVSGKKAQQKVYYWHSNYPGGFKHITYDKLMVEHPERIIQFAVDGMLPHNHLHDKMMKRLKVYAGPTPGISKVEKVVEVKKVPKRSEIKKIPIQVESKGRREGKR